MINRRAGPFLTSFLRQKGGSLPDMSKELAKADAPRHVRVLLLGGTIACFINEKGESTVVNIADYVKTFHALDDAVRISVKSFSRLDGYETKISDLVNVSKELKRKMCIRDSLYVAPERLETEAFLRFVRGADISLSLIHI